MAEHELSLNIENHGDRNSIRMNVIHELAKESPGTGRKDLASRYTYYVETLEDGRRVFLRRPASLHNGFDFVVCVENTNFAPVGKRRRNFPKHDEIVDDLKKKYDEDPETYSLFFTTLKAVYECQVVPSKSVSNSDFRSGFPCDLIIKVLKWLFIEQDIRYWNYSGRDMLWHSICDITTPE